MICSLANIKFPVYYLGINKPESIDMVLAYIVLDASGEAKVLVVDDKTIPGDSLAKRRLVLLAKGVKLKQLRISIHFLHDLIKYSGKAKWFIDSNGLVFKYSKTTRARLTYKPINKKIYLPAGGTVVEVDGCPERYKTLFRVPPEHKYAGILVTNIGKIFYGTYDKKYKDSYRLV